MIEKGMLLRCKTTTKNDVFGIVMWEVIETGLPAPENTRKGQMDGVKVMMLGGSGPSARAGISITDSEDHIIRDIKAGITTIVSREQKDVAMNQCQKKVTKTIPKHGGTGVIEM